MSDEVSSVAALAAEIVRQLEAYSRRPTARIFGSVAVSLLCPKASLRWTALGRSARKDIDLVFAANDPELAVAALRETKCIVNDNWRESYSSNRRLHGHHVGSEVPLEIFFQPLKFYQSIPLDNAFSGADTAIPVEQLLISKLQFKQMTRDQLIDVFILLEQFAVADIAPAGDGILSPTAFSSLLKSDWDLWKACERSFRMVKQFSAQLCVPGSDSVVRRAIELEKSVAHVRKTVKWRLRSMVPIPIGNAMEDE